MVGDYLPEEWVDFKTWETIKKNNAAYRKNAGRAVLEQYREGSLKKRINPETSKNFQFGDRNEKGQYFISYNPRRKYRAEGSFLAEDWGDFDAFHRACIGKALERSRARARNKSRPHTVNKEYLLSIFPSNYKCLVFGIDMSWLGNRNNSPSNERHLFRIALAELKFER